MINKKNLLGKVPIELGIKDAIHTAIVSVRAGKPIQPGERCKMNELREAIPDGKGVGVADPFRRGSIARGEWFWLLLDQDEVPNVAHVWEHATIDFSAPAVDPTKNKYLERYASQYGVTYEQLMEACSIVATTEKPAPYTGTLSADEVETARDIIGNDIWYEWKEESGHEFYNQGTDCCPEYCYPSCALFAV